jgi:UDP-N-acetylglucosamine--N-acetylmuramyl-(pentapeptide) pyrophosphoryl-undecaprenol N-acetylglucosamine transferase
MTQPRVVIAGGGTGGHVFPGLAVADALRAIADVDVVFVGSPRGMEKDIVPARGYALELVDVSPLKGGGVWRAASGAMIAAGATVKSIGLVRRLAPSVVLSVGGYAAGPVSLAAAMNGIPVGVLEPNALMGLANRWLAPVAKRIYVAWPGTSSRNTVLHVGVPIRAAFAPKKYVPHAKKRVLVMGGSLGAEAINERLPEALSRIGNLDVVHQTGRDRDQRVREAYMRLGLTHARVLAFLEDVAGELESCDLVVARAGAITVAEIAAVGRAALFIPFPHAADDHQAKNADALASAGGAIWIRQKEADVERLTKEIGALLGDDTRRVEMANAARHAGRPDAADRIARDLADLGKIELRSSRTNGHSRLEAN